MLYASPAYIEARGEPATVSELAFHDAVTYGRSGRVQSWMLEQERAILEFNLRSRFRFDDIDAIADAVADGLGLAWLPYWLVRKRIESEELVRVMHQISSHVSEVWAVWPERPRLPTRVRSAIDALAVALPKLASPP
ncbi:LysR substrate-binding domain-containing protein [Rhizobium leguminosarum]|uniref:LysR substrate-binding domain-containing protein n=1 Tax=Rhizobium leguminosarum TaxID=384 RepID=UPI000685585D|nr:LysR substrate-binding domain-containing protein [Rhizobium leguminosarum]